MTAVRRPECRFCERPLSTCFCHRLPTALNNRFPVLLLQHREERRHPIGTARIAQLGLAQCHTIDSDDDLGADTLAQLRALASESVLVYPGEATIDLDSLRGQRPRPLLFIDASWKKSRRLLLGSPFLQSLPRLSLSGVQASRYRIRRPPAPGFSSTLEAITHTLETLEQAPGTYQPLLSVMDWMIERQIEAMGQDTYRQHYAGA